MARSKNLIAISAIAVCCPPFTISAPNILSDSAPAVVLNVFYCRSEKYAVYWIHVTWFLSNGVIWNFRIVESLPFAKRSWNTFVKELKPGECKKFIQRLELWFKPFIHREFECGPVPVSVLHPWINKGLKNRLDHVWILCQIHLTSLIFQVPRVIMLYGNTLHCWLNTSAAKCWQQHIFFHLCICCLYLHLALSVLFTHLVYWGWEEWHTTWGKGGCQLFFSPLFPSVHFGWTGWIVAVEIIACPSYESICHGGFLIWFWGGEVCVCECVCGSPQSKTKQCVRIGHRSVSVAINIHKGNFTTHVMT